VRLVYHITEGKRIEVSKVLLTGYQYTRPVIIAREVQIQPGGPLRESDVVETERRLYNLAVFNRVQIASQNPNGLDPDKVIVVDTEEGRRYTIGYGFGFEVQRLAGGSTNPGGTTIGASPRGIFEIARSNMFGRAQTLSFKARASTLQYRGALAYTADNFLARRSLSLQLTGYADKTQDVNTFTSTRYEGAVQVVDKLSPASSLLYRYFYRRVEVSNLANTIKANWSPDSASRLRGIVAITPPTRNTGCSMSWTSAWPSVHSALARVSSEPLSRIRPSARSVVPSSSRVPRASESNRRSEIQRAASRQCVPHREPPQRSRA
jgi:outer membrane protein assembly factor BamA